MKNRIIFTLACLLAFVVSVSAQKKVSDYPNTATVPGTYLLLWARPGVTNYNQSYTQLAAQLSTNQYWQLLAPGYILYGSAAHTNAVYVDLNGEILSNAVGKITLAGGTYTSTGAVAGSAMTINTNQFVIKNGNAGFGTAAGLAKVSINGGLHVGGDSDPGDNNVLVDNQIAIVGNATGKTFTINTDQMVVTNGLTGLGTQNPSSRLHLVGSSTTDSSASFNCTSSSSFVNNSFASGSSSAYQYLFSQGYASSGRSVAGAFLLDVGSSGGLELSAYHTNGVIVFFTAGNNERARINSVGNFGIGTSSPNSLLHVAGPIATSVAFGGTATLGATNSTYFCNVDAQTITLPTAASIAGRIYTIKLIAPATTGTLTNATGAQLIDGALSYSLSASNKFVTVQSSGTNWWIIGNN